MMRSKITLAVTAVAAMLLSASVAGAQPVIQPNYQPPGSSGSGQAFVYQPGASVATRPMPSNPATQGPITGFGAGGMAHEPGTPPNAPYFHAGAGAGKR